jgi:phospholipase/lecithinase/hemolysin
MGGTNYAYGGARVALLPGVVDSPISPSQAVPIATQVSQYLAKGAADPNALYAINGGGNDFLYQFTLYATGAATLTQVQAALGAAAVDLGRRPYPRAAGANRTTSWSGTCPTSGPLWAATDRTLPHGSVNSFTVTVGATLDALGIGAIRLNSACCKTKC